MMSLRDRSLEVILWQFSMRNSLVCLFVGGGQNDVVVSVAGITCQSHIATYMNGLLSIKPERLQVGHSNLGTALKHDLT
jgi:hypothetical protein